MNTLFSIVISDDADETTKYAAEELQRHVEQLVVGWTPSIKTDGEKIGERTIIIGENLYSKKFFPDVQQSKLPREGYYISTRGPRMLILGGSSRGTLYGIYDLLERLGVRWWTPAETELRKKTVLEIPNLNVKYTPPLVYRATWYRNAMDGDWLARMRLNGGTFGGLHQKDRHGGEERYASDRGAHTYEGLVPTEKYFDRHPEYFCEVNGVRLRYNNQLCPTNPDVADIASETAREWIKKTPGTHMVSITQNDWGNWCTCKTCAKIIEKEDAPSAPALHLANEVAKRLEKEFPDVYIDTFAYAWTQKPPKYMKAHPNVMVRIAPIGNCFGHPIRTCPANADCREAVTKWSKISKNIFVWHYVTDFFHYMSPFPNLLSLEDDIHYYLEHGLKGLFLQGNGNSLCGDVSELKAYLMARIMWNPSLKAKNIREEFISGYYKSAGPFVEDYISCFEKAFAKAGNKFHLHLYRTLWENDSPYLERPVLDRARKFLEQAYRVAKDEPEILKRLDRILVGLDYTELFFYERPSKNAVNKNQLNCRTSQRRNNLAKRFFAVCGRENVSHYGEHYGRYTTITSLERAWLNSMGKHNLLMLKSGGAKMKIVPDLGGRIISYGPAEKSIRAGKNVLGTGSPDSFGYPCEGGYEEYSEKPHQSPGFSEKFIVLKKSASSAILSCNTETGLNIKRTIKIDSSGDVTISSALFNPKDSPIPSCFRAHIEIDLKTRPDKLKTWFLKNKTWQQREGKIGMVLYDDDVPDGWLFWLEENNTGFWQVWSKKEIGAGFVGTVQAEPAVITLDIVKYRENVPLMPKQKQTITHKFGWLKKLPF